MKRDKVKLNVLMIIVVLLIIGLPFTLAFFTVQTNSSFSSFLIQSSIEEFRPDIKININGTVNEAANYTRNISCSTGATPYWNRKWDSLVFSNVADEEEVCGLTYTQDTSNHDSALLSTVVQNNAIDESFILQDFTIVADVTNSLVNPTQFHYSSATATSGTSLLVWSLNANNEYESDPSLMTYNGGRYYHIYAGVPESGNYRICYTISSGSSSVNNGLYIAINGTTKYSILSSTSEEKSGCYDFYSLTTSDYINISVRKYNASAVVPVMKFRIERANNNTAYNPGYRYEGTNPDNYIWFNNEMWRIIGLVPTCTSANCATSQNLVKIIRNDSIGGIVFDDVTYGAGTGFWGNNSLYTLLNNYYWGKQDGTFTNNCYAYSNSARGKCDYGDIGLQSNDYYGSMVENVYWNIGSASSNQNVQYAYASEIQTQTVQGHIGVMNVSDYGYASSNQTVILQNYDFTSVTLANWLYKYSFEWTMTNKDNKDQAVQAISESGSILVNSSSNNINFGYQVRPVVYLSPNVYVVSGTGTEADPYMVAK